MSRFRRGFTNATATSDDDKKEDKPITVTILKPGQKLTIICQVYSLQFPDKGTYKLTATLEVKSEDKEVLPGMKLWSGTLKSEALDYEVTRAFKRRTPPKRQTPRKKDEGEKKDGGQGA